MNSAVHSAKVVLASVFDVEASDIPDDAGLESYSKWDSLAHMRIVLSLEEVLGRFLETEEILMIMDLQSIQKLMDEAG